MAESPANSNSPVKLAERFANSAKFKELFAQGMKLVEDSASYLDGEGRRVAKELERSSALLYGTESMRLTTRLMQLASWLLLQRAANEGEMSRDQIMSEKEKIKLENLPASKLNGDETPLPVEFTQLVEASLILQERIVRLDRELYDERQTAASGNPVIEQIDLLSTAFGVKKTG